MGVSYTAASQLEDELEQLKSRFEQGTLTPAHLSEYLETARACSDLIQRNLNRSSNLISDFKNTAVTSTQLVSSSFFLGELVKDILGSCQSDLDTYQVRCQVLGDRELMIQQDFGAIVQIVSSLIKNSCMHAFAESEISAEIEVSFELDNGYVVLNYWDNGVGIEASKWSSVFEPFFTTKRNQGGTGLGLTMVYNLVTHAMGGSIELLSPESGRGVLFHIRFPNGLHSTTN
jgi:signal transduction histidine kinase